MRALASTRALRRSTLAVLLASVVMPQSPAHAVAVTPSQIAIEAAVAGGHWLDRQVPDDGAFIAQVADENGQPISLVDYELTVAVAKALTSVPEWYNGRGRALYFLDSPATVAEFTRGAPFDREDAAYVGPTARLATLWQRSGAPTPQYGAPDLVGQLRSLITSDGRRLADRTDHGSHATVIEHAMALQTLRELEPGLVEGLFAVQCPDGSFPAAYPAEPTAQCVGDVDATAWAIRGLLQPGDSRMYAAFDWLAAQQQDDGSFVGPSPISTTANALVALGHLSFRWSWPSERAAMWLVEQQRADGSFDGGGGVGADLATTATVDGGGGVGADLATTAAVVDALALYWSPHPRNFSARRPPRGSIDPWCLGAPAAVFADLTSPTHVDAVNCLAADGIVAGTGPATYTPAAPVTRAQMATFIARTIVVSYETPGIPAMEESPFSDVQLDSTHGNAIAWLAYLEIVQGVAPDRFDPSAPVSRAQMASFLVRTYTRLGHDALPPSRLDWEDVGPENPHADAIGRISDAGLARGITSTSFGPTGVVSREQMASFIARMLNVRFLASEFDYYHHYPWASPEPIPS